MKMHMLSVWFRGKRHTWFASFKEGEKPRVTEEDLKRIGVVESGHTFAVGI